MSQNPMSSDLFPSPYSGQSSLFFTCQVHITGGQPWGWTGVKWDLVCLGYPGLLQLFLHSQMYPCLKNELRGHWIFNISLMREIHGKYSTNGCLPHLGSTLLHFRNLYLVILSLRWKFSSSSFHTLILFLPSAIAKTKFTVPHISPMLGISLL